MQNLKFTILVLGLFLSSQSLKAQCSLPVNSGGFDYSLNVLDLSVDNVIYTQMGSTCNVNIVVGYDISVDTNGAQPSWWNQEMYTLQGNFNCVGGSGASFFNLPNGGGQGTATSATFSYANTLCSNVVLDCPITLQVNGPNLNYNGTCGNLISVVLPIELSNFTYNLNGNNQLEVQWQTEQEENMSHFELERSTDLINWERLAQIKAHNADVATTYYQNVNRLDQKQYLRLKMIDQEENAQFSEVLVVEKINTAELAISPNPVSAELILHGFDADQVILANSVGQVFEAQKIADNKLDVSSLPQGLYFIRSTKHTAVKALQFLKQ